MYFLRCFVLFSHFVHELHQSPPSLPHIIIHVLREKLTKRPVIEMLHISKYVETH